MSDENALTKHPNYYRANQGVHRKAVGPVGAPALTWHLVLWRPKLGKPGTSEERAIAHEARLNDRARAVGAYVKSLYGFLSARSDIITFGNATIGQRGELGFNAIGFPGLETSLLDCNSIPELTRGNYINFAFFWNGLSTNIRIEAHTEYVILSSIIDLSITPDTSNIRAYERPSPGLSLSDALESLNKKFCSSRESAYESEHSELYNVVWSGFAREVVDRGGILSPDVGMFLLDLRGVVLSEPFPHARRRYCGRLGRSATYIRNEDHRNDYPLDHDPDWARNILRRIWPFISLSDPTREADFTVSTLLNGRALFTSSMGPQAEPKEEMSVLWAAGRHKPVNYFLYSYTDDAWQIGRLIDRVHQVGTMRLASIVEIDSLHYAGAKLDKLEGILAGARSTIHSQASQPTGDSSMSVTIKSFEAAQEELEKIDYEFIDYDMKFRLERSRYYISQFSKICDDMRIERIEGFQPYDEFVYRRLGGSFTYIDMIYNRLRDIKSDMTSLYQYCVSHNIATITDTISKRDDEIGKRNKEIANIQIWGEVILIAILMPYYIGGIVSHMLGLSEPKNEISELRERAVWFAAIAAGILTLSLRLLKNADGETSKTRRLLSYLLMAVGILLVLAAVLLIVMGQSV
jgi:hypothetical protein